MKKLHLIGNLKMNLSLQELKPYFEQFKLIANNTNNTVGVCVPSVYLGVAESGLKGSKAKFGSQNVHFATSGAYTGEISVNMVKDFNANLVIVGHSERRQMFLETDETVNKKVLKVLEGELTPILCVGETLQERETGKTFEVIENQLVKGLSGVSADELNKLYIAYEPIWAIGTGVSATSNDAESVIKFIKELLVKNFGKTTNVLYGGSLNEKNADEILNMPSIDGGLIGGACLNLTAFEKIVNTVIK